MIDLTLEVILYRIAFFVLIFVGSALIGAGVALILKKRRNRNGSAKASSADAGSANTEYVMLLIVGALSVALGINYLGDAMNNSHTRVADSLGSQVAGGMAAGEVSDNGDGTYTVRWSGGVPPYTTDGAVDTDGDDHNTTAVIELPTIEDHIITIRDDSNDVITITIRREVPVLAVTTAGIIESDGTEFNGTHTVTFADACSASPTMEAAASDGSTVYRMNDNATLSLYDVTTGNTQTRSLPVAVLSTSFIDAKDGRIYYYGSDNRFYTSDDKGTTWASQSSLFGVTHIDIVDADTAYAVNGGAGVYRIHKTEDAGTTWTELGNVPASNFASSASAFKTITSLNNSLWMVAHALESFTSNDGGTSWTEHATPRANPQDVAALDEQTLVCVGGNVANTLGYVMRSADGGATWQDAYVATDTSLMSVTVIDNLNVFACGTNGRIIKSVDGGLTWTELPVQVDGSPLTDTVLRVFVQ